LISRERQGRILAAEIDLVLCFNRQFFHLLERPEHKMKAGARRSIIGA
jgi:hypothetical protein